MKDKSGGHPPAEPSPPGPGSTRRIPKTGSGAHPAPGRLTSRQRAPKDESSGKVEVVSVGGGGSGGGTGSIRRHGAEQPEFRGISLRWKIMIAMAAVTVTAALLIFVVVYTKTVDQLNIEIDTKGERLINTLASIDAEYWTLAIYQDRRQLREEALDRLVSRLVDGWTGLKGEVFKHSGALKYRYDNLLDSPGKEKVVSARDFLKEVRDSLKSRGIGPRGDVLDDRLRRLDGDGQFQGELTQLLDPLRGGLQPFEEGGIKLRDGGDIVQLSVQDITGGEEKAPDISVHKVDMRLTTPDDSTRRTLRGGIKVYDANAIETVDGARTLVPSRSFTMDRDIGPRKLRFWVLLSLDHINEAKSQLRTAIFLPTLLSVLLGLAIAWLISQRITEPVKILMEDIHQVSQGHLEHQTHPHSSDEIGMLADSFNRMTSALQAAHAQEIEAKAMEHELNIAAEIQANLVPKKVLKLPGYDISAYYRPSKEVGGDYYDFIDIDEKYVGIIVADVSGKGVPGSLVMSMARALIRMEAERSRNTSPASTMINVNRMLAQDIKKGMFVTAVYCIVNKETNEIAVSSAGHNPMVVWRSATNQVDLVNPKGMALGFDKGPMFERTISEETIRLGKGDRLVMYTDGAVEAMNAAGEEFGDDKFYALCAQLATRDSNQFLNLVVKALDGHKGEAPQHDDQTIVTLRYL